MTKAEREKLRALLEIWRDYHRTSSKAAHTQHQRGREKDAYGRACEASTLAVCIADLEKVVPR